MPASAKWLGGLGATPFIFLSISSHLVDGDLQGQAAFALAAYGAIILSFLGGVHWGLAIAGFTSEHEEPSDQRLALSVVPSLNGWGALLLPATAGMLLLAAAFVAMLWLDEQATAANEAPAWYPTLRRPLTFFVVIALVVGALA